MVGPGAPIVRWRSCERARVVWVSDAPEEMSTLSRPRSVDLLSSISRRLTADRTGGLREMRHHTLNHPIYDAR